MSEGQRPITKEDPEPALYYEDLEPRRRHVTSARTVTEADVVAFAGISGDYNPLHVDAEFAAGTAFGERVAHGLLVLSIASGLSTRLPMSERLHPNILGLLDLQCRWPSPTRIGDTVHVVLTVTDRAPTSKPDRGVVTLSRDVVNQRGEVVMESRWKLLIRTRSTGTPSR